MERDGFSRAAFFVVLSRIRGLFGRERLDADFAEELKSHLEMLAEAHERRGLTRDDALRAARLEFGGPMQVAEARRDQRGLPFLDTTLQDLRYGVRALRRNPVYAMVAIATLAIGIATGTAMFSFARAVLLRPLPYADPDRLVRVFETNPLKRWTRNIASPANYADWRRQNRVFTDMAAYEQFDSSGSGAIAVSLTGYGEPQPLKALGVTGNLFGVLGAPPLLGRVFTDEETYEGKARVVMISFGAWQTIFGGDPAIVGRTVTLSGRTYDVVGVMPREFFFPGRDVQIWMPVGYAPSLFEKSRRPHWLGVVARRKPGVSLADAQQQMNAIARELERQYPDTNTQMGVRLEGFHDSLAFDEKPALLMLSGAVGLFFLLVCANIANLQVGRAAVRGHELAVRHALGAGRTRLVRQLVTESLLISFAGCLLGLPAAAFAREALVRAAASAVPVFADVRFDRSVVLFAVALATVAPLLFGVAPALSASRGDRLVERAAAGSRRATSARNLLVAAEVALSVILLAGSMLLVRSLIRLQQVDPGFAPDHVVSFQVSLPRVRYGTAAQQVRAFADLERRLRDVPGVQAVGATSTLALRGYTWTGDATVEGRAAADYERELRHESVTPGYFQAMGIRLVGGRMLNEHDGADANVTLVNESLAARYFRGANPVGKRVKFGRPIDNGPWITIIGVVADAKQDGIDRPVQPEVYVPYAMNAQNPATFVVRSTLDPASIVTAARQAVRAVDRELLLTEVTTLDDLVRDSMAAQRFRTTLLTGFAAVALFLAALGIYGVLAYMVARRSRELGVRLALGANPRALFAMIVAQGMRPVAAGAAAGLAAAIGLARLIASLLFDVTPLDPVSFGATISVLLAIALVACVLPALRATRVDPLVALRDE